MLPEEADRLFDLPLGRFVADRNALAAELKKAGRGQDSKAVKALERPAIPAWVANQLARKHPDLLERYLKASDRLLRAHVRAMGSGAAAAGVAEASKEQRVELAALLERGGAILERSGHGSRELLYLLAATLRAATLDETARAQLEAGRMSGEVAETGFDALAAQLGSLPEAPPRPPAKLRLEPFTAKQTVEVLEQRIAHAARHEPERPNPGSARSRH